MEKEEYKKYNILENILQNINRKYVALPDDETKRNNKLLQVIDRIIQSMRSKNVLFENLYQNKFYGGSFYDGLKVGNPDEYDLDCLLCLPKIIEPTVVVSDKPGYVHVAIKNMKALEKNPLEAQKYVGLNNLLDGGDRLSTKKVKSWIESIMTSAINHNKKIEVEIDEDNKCIVNSKVSKSGPAHTIKLDGDFQGKTFNVDIDLVPCFTFSGDQWPKAEYRKNTSETKKTFFVVPKSPSEDDTQYWRLSFQEQERELISGYSVMKPTIRLLKKIRDRHQHKIASYYIKTVFLWEQEKVDKNFWSKSLSFVFATMLRKYSEYIENKSIPYFWNKKSNLIGDLSDATTSNVSNKIRNIADHIDRICNTTLNAYAIVPYLLTTDDVNIDKFKEEVPLGKKFLKQINAAKTPVTNVCAIKASSSSSSFEAIPDEVEANSGSDLRMSLAKVELMCVSLMSGQKRTQQMLEGALEKIENSENRISHLNKEFERKTLEVVDRTDKLATKIDSLGEKLDEVLKKSEPSTDDHLGDLLNIGDKLKSTLEFQRP